MSCFRQSFLKEPSVVKKTHLNQGSTFLTWSFVSFSFPWNVCEALWSSLIRSQLAWNKNGWIHEEKRKHQEPRAIKEGCTSKRSNLCFYWNKQTGYWFGDISFESKKLVIKNTGWFMMTFICQVESYDRRKQGKQQHWLFSGVSLVFNMSSDFTSLKAYILGRRRRTTALKKIFKPPRFVEFVSFSLSQRACAPPKRCWKRDTSTSLTKRSLEPTFTFSVCAHQLKLRLCWHGSRGYGRIRVG